MEDPGERFQLGAKAQPQPPQLLADAGCIAWIQEKLQLLCPAEGSAASKDIDDPAEWMLSLWDSNAHSAIASNFLLDVKVRPGKCYFTPTFMIKI